MSQPVSQPKRQSTPAHAVGGPVQPSVSTLRPLSAQEVNITGGFWHELQNLAADAVIDHALNMMEEHGWLQNFDKAAAGTLQGKATGMWFVDSETYKILEAMAWALSAGEHPELEQKYHALVQRVAAAQEPDGYLNTFYGRDGQDPRWSNFEMGHELYCFGHLIQAGVARLRTGHDDALVEVCRRVADHVVAEFGGPEGRQAICGHAEIEMAMLEFGRATGTQAYQDVAQVFIERHGDKTLKPHGNSRTYYQDDEKIRDVEVLSGHAVRALYLACGAIDVATEFGDDELAQAVHTQWRNTVAARTYITGGMGSTNMGEAFGQDYQLPADTSYAETCAGIASVMLSWRLLLHSGDTKYAELIERTLLNNVLASPAADGRAFFYANTHHQRVAPPPPAEDGTLQAGGGSGLRKSWFGTSCCPTNIARTLSSVHLYLATATSDELQVHQYAQAEYSVDLEAGRLGATVSTDYPDDDAVSVVITEAPDTEVGISLRIPAWCTSPSMSVDSQPVTPEVVNGRARLRGVFSPGTEITLVLPREVRIVRPDPRVDAVRGTVALERGPWVLSLEDIDLGEGLTVNQVVLDSEEEPVAAGANDAEVRLRVLEDPRSWPFTQQPASSGEVELTAILHPYRTWAERGPTTMRIFLPTTEVL